VQEIADRRYAENRAREDTQARNFEASLGQIRADVGDQFVASVEAKLVAYAEDHDEQSAWNCLHAVCEPEYRAAVKQRLEAEVLAEMATAHPGQLPRRAVTPGQPGGQPEPPNELTREVEAMGWSTKPPSEDAPLV